ncbi:unnamed protein product [Blepharisma stoltei]|uniref:Uncharacterized protein n=1 Tax=Blepharisma stoltei TaxID=1481888 RepID=A0AAU9JHY8_9CILI|nr:unnamed protein product [Blepharisma stoltei]
MLKPRKRVPILPQFSTEDFISLSNDKTQKSPCFGFPFTPQKSRLVALNPKTASPTQTPKSTKSRSRPQRFLSPYNKPNPSLNRSSSSTAMKRNCSEEGFDSPKRVKDRKKSSGMDFLQQSTFDNGTLLQNSSLCTEINEELAKLTPASKEKQILICKINLSKPRKRVHILPQFSGKDYVYSSVDRSIKSPSIGFPITPNEKSRISAINPKTASPTQTPKSTKARSRPQRFASPYAKPRLNLNRSSSSSTMKRNQSEEGFVSPKKGKDRMKSLGLDFSHYNSFDNGSILQNSMINEGPGKLTPVNKDEKILICILDEGSQRKKSTTPHPAKPKFEEIPKLDLSRLDSKKNFIDSNGKNSSFTDNKSFADIQEISGNTGNKPKEGPICFQEEFMSKFQEFSESWRNMIQDQTRT